jgi:hypothetical protein
MSLFASTASDRNIAKRGALSGKRNTEDLAGEPKHLSRKESPQNNRSDIDLDEVIQMVDSKGHAIGKIKQHVCRGGTSTRELT